MIWGRHKEQDEMATAFLVVICVGFVVVTGVYIAVMNREWWGKK